MQTYLEKLNKQQYEAATTTDGPLLILAGAGSGKTNTMTHRIAYLIKDLGVSPYSILAVTFTNKAAGEMRDRVEELVGPMPGMWIKTFHSACLMILRKYADRLGYEKNFVVYDPSDQKALVKSIVKAKGYDEKRYTPAYVLAVISDCKEKEISPAKFEREAALDQQKIVGRIYGEYETELKKNNAMDFDDLILRTVQLFETDEEVLEEYRQRFRYIMVDEYQDTNMLQYKLVKYLAQAHGNICVVGDDDQCIYQWRGADIRNILEFEKDFPGAKVIKLEENYRSTGNILEAAYSVISLNSERKDKKLWTRAGDGEKIEYYRADDDNDEARYTAEKIRSLMRKDGSLKYSDFAILYRTNAQSRKFEDMLSARGLPYQVLSGQRYYERKEIKDMLAYMRLVQNPKDDVSFQRIINEPKRGAGPKTVSAIGAAASALDMSMLEALNIPELKSVLSAKTQAAFTSLYKLLNGLNIEKENMSVGEIYDEILVQSGYLAALQEQNDVEADGRIENLMEFKSVIEEKEKDAAAKGESLTLENFMEGMALLSDIDNHDPNQDAVSLMTMHSAKGLEFEVVFMPGMETGIFPSYRSLDEGGLEEERRLCYVGMTRAKRRLFMSSAEVRMLYGKTDYTSESQFLKEIDRKFMTGSAVYQKRNMGESRDRYSTSVYMDRDTYVSPIRQAAAVRTSVSSAAKQTLAGTAVFPGMQVEHPKFGRGTVIECTSSTLTVIFEDFGTKKLARDLAPLKVIND